MAYGIVFCLLLQGDVVQAIAQRGASRAARGEAVAAGRKTDAGSSHSPDVIFPTNPSRSCRPCCGRWAARFW